MANSENLKKGFWDFKAYQEKEWFKMLVLTLSILAVIYILLHLFINSRYNSKSGYEYSKLDKTQMEQINRIYFDTSSLNKIPADTTKSKNDSLQISDTTKPEKNNDTGAIASTQIKKIQKQIKDSSQCLNHPVCDKVINYLKNQFNNKIDSVQIVSMRKYLCCCSALEATSFLSNVRLQIKSYFWLTGPSVYFEIIFWAWFGVLCSLLFNLGVIGKNSTTDPTDRTTYFDSSEIPYQFAKLLYAPACTLIIVLGYNFFNDQNIVDISSSKGVIVFAFIGGFYSSRLISFLDRLKELLLPVSTSAAMSTNVPPLKNVIIELTLDKTITTNPLELSTATVTLQNKVTKEETRALNLAKETAALFIADYIKPGNYIIQASYTKTGGDNAGNFKASQEIEMKTADIFIKLQITADAGAAAGEGEAKNLAEKDNASKQTLEKPVDETPVDIDVNKKSEDNNQ